MKLPKDRNLKILFITKWYPDKEDPQFGVFIQKHAQAVALYAEVAVLFIAPLNPEFHSTDFYISDVCGVRQYFIYYKKSTFKAINVLRNFLALQRGWKAVLKNSWRPTFIHANVLPRTAVMAYYLSIKNDLPFIITEHWVGYTNKEFFLKPFWYRWIARLMVNKSACITVVSQSLNQSMINNGFKGNFKVIGNVVDLPTRPQVYKQSFEKITILTVADLYDEQKNISDVIKVIGKIAQRRNDFVYHIIGGGPDETLLVNLTRSLGLLDSVIFFDGKKNNIAVYESMQMASFIVVNSNTESFSVVTAESLACGKPVIATISGGPEELLTIETGMLIEKKNPIQLENAILKMLDNYQQFVPEKLQAVVASSFSREEIGKKFVSLYRELLQARKL